jgi:hypothetical protein
LIENRKQLGLEIDRPGPDHPRECTDGTAASFDQARADFEGRVASVPAFPSACFLTTNNSWQSQ